MMKEIRKPYSATPSPSATKITPLIVEIPDRHGTSQITQTISRYVSDAIGVTI